MTTHRNDCVGNYIYQEEYVSHNTIKHGDVVKIELGVNIGGCIAVLGETIIYNSQENNSNQDYSKYLDLLNELSLSIPNIILPGALNDDVKIMIESKCILSHLFPIGHQYVDS